MSLEEVHDPQPLVDIDFNPMYGLFTDWGTRSALGLGEDRGLSLFWGHIAVVTEIP